MKKWINTSLALGTLGASAVLVGSALRMTRYVKKELQQADHKAPPLHSGDQAPKVVLMVPCRGLDPDFRENMAMLTAQDYPNYEIIFMTANAADKSYPVLQEMVQRSPVPARIVFGGFSKQRCQKLDNMLAAIDDISNRDAQPDIYAWADSDARVTAEWLRYLVAPLSRPEVGATTTYRWYRPEHRRPLTHVLALWTGIQITHMHVNANVAVWGGSMAVRRETFDQLKMREIWQTALADDCVLNDTVRKAGLRVEFVVPAMTSLSSDHSVKDILIFAVRQCVIGKHTLKPIWWPSIFALSLFHFSAGRGAWLLGRSLLKRQAPPWQAWGMLSFLPAGILQGLTVIQLMRQIKKARNPQDPLEARYSWAAYSPLAYLFTWFSLAASGLTNRFVWRDIVYRMHNAHRTEVCFYPPELETAQSEEDAPSGAKRS
ncbi:MAG: glycosyltransferase [Candidatus Sericytochromatia bacterium]|nr:glycosyltransferase [Candidatus Sericytochromatia bacterium]